MTEFTFARTAAENGAKALEKALREIWVGFVAAGGVYQFDEWLRAMRWEDYEALMDLEAVNAV